MARDDLPAVLPYDQAGIVHALVQAEVTGVLLGGAAVRAHASQANLEVPPVTRSAALNGEYIAIDPDPENIAKLVAAIHELSDVRPMTSLVQQQLAMLKDGYYEGVTIRHPEGFPPITFIFQPPESPRSWSYSELAEGSTAIRVGDVFFGDPPLEGSLDFPVASLDVVIATNSDPDTVRDAQAVRWAMAAQQAPGESGQRGRTGPPTPPGGLVRGAGGSQTRKRRPRKPGGT